MKLSLYMAALLAIACTSCADNTGTKITKIIKKNLEDSAFANNLQVHLLEVSKPTLTRLTERGYIDFVYWELNGALIAFRPSIQKAEENAQNSLQTDKLTGHVQPATQGYIDEFDRLRLINTQYSDRLIRLGKQDADAQVLKYYKAKVLVKATLGNQNLLDSITYILDDNLAIINYRDSLPRKPY